jgi:hypothetical protein
MVVRVSQFEITAMVNALAKHYKTEVMYGKGGFFIRGTGDKKTQHISLAKARSITGIKPEAKRNPMPKSGGYGDYAIMRKIAGKF